METYKIGNKVKCLIRSFSNYEHQLGDTIITYQKQPYTIIEDCEASLFFKETNSLITQRYNELAYNHNDLTSITLYDVLLTNKILDLIYSKKSKFLVSKWGNYTSDDSRKIFLSEPSDTVCYNIFVYNTDGQLETMLPTTEQNANTWLNNTITVQSPNSSYFIVYEVEDNTLKGYDTSCGANQYFTLDIMIEGNKDNDTSTSYLHIEKCGIEVSKNMHFGRNTNTVDLTFNIINTKNNYIALA